MFGFRKKKKNWGVVCITPYMTTGLWGDAPQDILAICHKISRKLDEYEGVMVAHGRKENSPLGFMRLQQISANYDTYTGDISVSGSGNKFFSWRGKLEDFLGDRPNISELFLTNS